MNTKVMTLNEELQVKITEIERIKGIWTQEVYAKKLLKLKKKYFKKIAKKYSCELDLSSFQNLNILIDKAFGILLKLE